MSSIFSEMLSISMPMIDYQYFYIILCTCTEDISSVISINAHCVLWLTWLLFVPAALCGCYIVMFLSLQIPYDNHNQNFNNQVNENMNPFMTGNDMPSLMSEYTVFTFFFFLKCMCVGLVSRAGYREMVSKQSPNCLWILLFLTWFCLFSP